MRQRSSNRVLRTLTRLAMAAGAAGVLAVGVAQAPAGAATGPPWATATKVTSSVTKPVTGQPVTFTATVTVPFHSSFVPTGTVTFTITSNVDSSTVNCDSGNVVATTGNTASCTVSGGLLASLSTYAVTASYVDTNDSTYNSSQGSLTTTVLPGKTTTGVTSSVDPSVTGQPVDFTATVAVVSPAVGALSGSVTFTGVTCDAGNTVPVTGGMAQCAVSAGLTHTGSSYTVTAAYGSDPNFAASSGHVGQVVSADAATVVLSANPNTCSGNLCTATEGTPIAFTGTVSANAPGAGTPAGSLVFKILPAGSKTSLTCSGGNTQPVVTGQATCSLPAGLPADVYYTVSAQFTSDPNYLTATATLYENEGLLSTSTTLSVAPKSLGAGESFTVTAQVNPLATSSNAPTGYVDITVCGANSVGPNGCQGGAAAVDPVTGQAQLLVGGGEFPGTYYVHAQYLGDQNFYSSVAKSKSILIGLSSTAIAISSSLNPSVDSAAVSLTAVLNVPDGAAGSTLVGPPTGSLVFTITGPSGTITCLDGNNVPLGTDQVEGSAQCILPYGTLTDPAAPGNTTYAVNVTYAGDSNFRASAANFTQTVVPPA